ncbi:hypothetical protein Tco_0148991 [Tanacetum coccineum]
MGIYISVKGNCARFSRESPSARALLQDGWSPDSIVAHYTTIRGIIHTPQGRLLSPQTYTSYGEKGLIRGCWKGREGLNTRVLERARRALRRGATVKMPRMAVSMGITGLSKNLLQMHHGSLSSQNLLGQASTSVVISCVEDLDTDEDLVSVVCMPQFEDPRFEILP